MRIALVSEHADPLGALGGADAGGQNVHVAALAAGLARSGHDVVVHTRRAHPDLPERVVADEGYRVDRVTAGPVRDIPKDDLLPHMDAFGDRLRERWAAEPVDLVHAHFWMSGLASLRATRGTDTPVVQTFHALGSVKRRHQGLADTSPRARIDLERRLCRRVTHVISTCADEVSELRRLGLSPGRASIVPCGVDTDRFTAAPPRDPDRPPRLLVLGRLVPRKGVDTVIEALRRLPGVELVVVGGPPADDLTSDPEVARLQQVADEEGVADRVRFVGGVPQDGVPPLVHDSDVVVTVPWYEPFGIVPLEAMACGRPVVASAVGGMLDTVVPGVTGEHVAPRCPDELASVLQSLLADPARRRTYGEAGRRRAEQLFGWSRVVDRTESVYRSLVHAGELEEAAR